MIRKLLLESMSQGYWHTTTALRQFLWNAGEEPTFAQTVMCLDGLLADGLVERKKRSNGFQWRWVGVGK